MSRRYPAGQERLDDAAARIPAGPARGEGRASKRGVLWFGDVSLTRWPAMALSLAGAGIGRISLFWSSASRASVRPGYRTSLQPADGDD